MNRMHAVAAIAALAFASLSYAQAPGGTGGQRGSTGPGMSQDGSRPADGAITGGSIAPGETGGVPDNSKGAPTSSERAISRCNDLSGTLREQCLLQESGASAGGRSCGGRAPFLGASRAQAVAVLSSLGRTRRMRVSADTTP